MWHKIHWVQRVLVEASFCVTCVPCPLASFPRAKPGLEASSPEAILGASSLPGALLQQSFHSLLSVVSTAELGFDESNA